MPVKIRLSRGGAKKRPFFRIIVADSRRSRDGKFIDQIGTYNPMLAKDNPERVKINIDKAKNWIVKGAQPSERVKLFLSNIGLMEKPVITEKTKKHLPKKKTQEKSKATKKTEEPVKEETKTEEVTEVKSKEEGKISEVEATKKTEEPVKEEKEDKEQPS